MYSENKLLYLEETQLIEQFEQDLRQTLSTHDLSVVENFDIVFLHYPVVADRIYEHFIYFF